MDKIQRADDTERLPTQVPSRAILGQATSAILRETSDDNVTMESRKHADVAVLSPTNNTVSCDEIKLELNLASLGANDGSMKETKPVVHSKTNKKRPGWKKPADMPKRPLSAYNLFFAAERKELQQSGALQKKGDLGFGGLARNVAAKWNNLDSETKRAYIKKAEIGRERYRHEMRVYREKVALQRKVEDHHNHIREIPGRPTDEVQGSDPPLTSASHPGHLLVPATNSPYYPIDHHYLSTMVPCLSHNGAWVNSFLYFNDSAPGHYGFIRQMQEQLTRMQGEDLSLPRQHNLSISSPMTVPTFPISESSAGETSTGKTMGVPFVSLAQSSSTSMQPYLYHKQDHCKIQNTSPSTQTGALPTLFAPTDAEDVSAYDNPASIAQLRSKLDPEDIEFLAGLQEDNPPHE